MAHFTLHASMCESCYKKLYDERMYGGGMIKSSLGGTASQHTLPLSDNVIDPLVYLHSQKEPIKDTLTTAVIEHRYVYIK